MEKSDFLKEQEDQKLVLSIYRIDKDNFDFNTFSDIVNQIMWWDTDYREEEVINDNKMKIYYKEVSSNYKKWNNFFKWKIKEDNFFMSTDTLTWEIKIKSSNFLSFICFFEVGNEVFIVSSWKWYILFDRWCDPYFWLNIITRLLDKNSKALKHLMDNSLSWSNFESSFIFRNNESFLSQDDFWKIFKESIAELSEDKLALIWIDSKKRINCLAKTNFTLKTWISFTNLKNKVLPNIARLLKREPKFIINQVKEIKKKDQDYPKLLEELFSKMYSNLLDFDFFPPKDVWDFFNASEYKILWKQINFESSDLTNIEQINWIIADKKLSLVEFRQKLETTYINSIDEKWTNILSESFALYRWLHWEIEYQWLHYFWLNGSFWRIEKKFLEDFNEKAFNTLKDNKLDIKNFPLSLKTIWIYENEWPYNIRHKKEFIVLDKKRVHDIEFCDLLYYNNNETFIVHVKRGFDRDIRVLSSQILTWARLLTEVRNWATDNSFFVKLYAKINTDLKITEDEFIKLFGNDKKIYFILAYTTWNKIKTLDDVKKIRSNIAKLEIFETFKEFKKFSPAFELKIFEIWVK